MSLFKQSISSSEQYSRANIDSLLALANELKSLDSLGRVPQCLTGRVMSSLFFENSSRTYCSFVAAMQKLGGSVVSLPIESSSFASKGESLFDTIKTVDSYSDVIVLRHPDPNAISVACGATEHSVVLNAGNGAGEHPTQALLDVFTIHSELGRIDDLNVVLVGDLKFGRTVHSLSKLLGKFNNVRLYCVAHDSLQMPNEVLKSLDSVSVSLHNELTKELVSEADVIYVTRVQKERFSTEEEYEAVKGKFCVNASLLSTAKPAGQMVVMHPLPRNEELSTDLDSDPRAAYFRQMRYGLYARMALLIETLGASLLSTCE
uniref:aspartate carbamoyltransferase n=1 Tax=Parabodo caudatus TaxID=351713 RepID=A9CQ07_9EUGL|nr:aspartate carbamoyltransferase [Parabodo caudatus]